MFLRDFMDDLNLKITHWSRVLACLMIIHPLNYRCQIQYILLFIQIDFWKPDSVTQIKPHSTVDFRVKAEDIFTVEDFLKQHELQYE